MELSLPAYDYKVKKQNGAVFIFDDIRRKYVALTPEEWVRQHFIHYLITCRHYPAALIAVEKEIEMFGQKRRFDIVCFDRSSRPYLIVECKAPAVMLTQSVFDQVFGYNLIMAAPYVAVTNGIVHHCGQVCPDRQFTLLTEIPEFGNIE